MSEQDRSVVTDVLHREIQDRQALSLLLGDLRKRDGHHLSIQVRMGDVPSYVTSVTLRWVASNVRFAADLPMFQKDVSSGHKQIRVDENTIHMIQQRKPDWRRQLPMTAYLVRPQHKFPPLLLVAYQPWIFLKDSEKWAPDATAMTDSITVSGLEPTGTYWNLDDSETRFYALDGQHRLMAIMGLHELLTSGSIPVRNAEGEQTRRPPLSRDDIIGRLHGEEHLVHEQMQHLMDERIGIEIVPAVLSGETRDGAFRRLRQLFVDVNEHAKSLSSSELVQLDESNGFRIVARALMSHRLLRHAEGAAFERVHTQSPTLRDTSPSYTTLHTLSVIAERYLMESGKLPKLSLWQPLVDRIYQRPDDEGLKTATGLMNEYFDAISTLPSHAAYVEGKPAGEIRTDDDNILFRPVAQTALAEAMGKLSGEGVSLTSITSVLAEQEERGQLRLTDESTPWFGVLCDPVSRKMRRYRWNEQLCCRMFLYLLGGGIPHDLDREELRKDFAYARRIDDDESIAFDGARVGHKKIRLPAPWR